jgi:hypothetical protein
VIAPPRLAREAQPLLLRCKIGFGLGWERRGDCVRKVQYNIRYGEIVSRVCIDRYRNWIYLGSKVGKVVEDHILPT